MILIFIDVFISTQKCSNCVRMKTFRLLEMEHEIHHFGAKKAFLQEVKKLENSEMEN